MAYTLIEQYARDIDYFLTFPDVICHFASAGSRLPLFVEENDLVNEENLRLIPLVSADVLGDLDVSYEINPNLSLITGIPQDSEDFQSYIRDFVGFAKLGFFSFDKTYINEREDGRYHLVAYPKKESDAEIVSAKWRAHLSPLLEIRGPSFPPFWRHLFYRGVGSAFLPFDIRNSARYFYF